VGVSSPAICSVAVVKAHQPKLSPLGLNFTRTDLRRPVQNPLCFCYFQHKYVHAVCVRSMSCAGISIWHDHVRQAKSWLVTEIPPGNPRRVHKTMAGYRITPVLGFWTKLRQYCFYASSGTRNRIRTPQTDPPGHSVWSKTFSLVLG
jgi:hypothetical protein